MRTDLTFEMPPGRIASSISSTGASRTASHDGKRVAQAQEGDVAVAVVGRLREHGQHELGDRVAVGRHQRDAVDLRAGGRGPAARAHVAAASRRRRSACAWRVRGERLRQTRAHGIRHADARISSRGARGERSRRRARAGGRCSGAAPRRIAASTAHLPRQRRRRTARRRCRCTCTACRTSSDDWLDFLERSGGLAPDLPGFGRSGKPRRLRLHDRGVRGLHRVVPGAASESSACSLVVHDWGAVGLAFAQRHPERVERLVVINAVPFLPGYRWHRTARIWRTPVLGELSMGSINRARAASALARGQRDTGTDAGQLDRQRAGALRPGHAARDPAAVPRSPPERAGGGRRATSASSTSRRWSCGAMRDPYIPARFAEAYADAARRRAARAARRRSLAVARPPGRDRPRRRVPRRRVG